MVKSKKTRKPAKKEKTKTEVKQEIRKLPEGEFRIKATPEKLEKERKILCIVMAVAGAIIWMITPMENTESIIVRIIGIFIFIYGLSGINKYEPMSKKRLWTMLGLGFLVLGLVALVLILFLLK